MANMKPIYTEPTKTTNLVDRIAQSSAGLKLKTEPPATSAPEDLANAQAKEQHKNIDGTPENWRFTVPVLFRRTHSSSKILKQPQTDSGASLEQNVNLPVNQFRGSSLQRAHSKFSSFTRRISKRLRSLSPRSPLWKSPDEKVSTLDRPSEWPDMTELDYLRRKNLAEARRAEVYAEGVLELESAATNSGPPRAHHERVQSAPAIVQQHSNSSKPLSSGMRIRSFEALSFLPRSPEDYSEYDFPDVEYLIRLDQPEKLMYALNEIIDHEEKCNPMSGLCDHKYKSRSEEIRYVELDDEHEDGQWFPTIEEAWATCRPKAEEEEDSLK
ncbi:uncharacterized protein LY89DRAFT_666313 [Mollisia scopiformis]|uniref:Uncharacterized protein n=1 Tax=Mollisia scopiformis TaxID=149040 RepID=A0A194XKJ2_MOLSC|nr:uncharacterized protein LY89DRAFT_666313 [Mollisia scopiformis]KUJ20661.1 hypothetical protein LY89DRAFT_666313 [Mollisia scopiformis]